MDKIAVVGAGYVGLVSAACFAKHSKVVVIERDQKKIEQLKSGKIPFYEPGLDALVLEGIKTEKLIFVSNISESLNYNPSIFFICVGTPSNEDGGANLNYVWDVAAELGENLVQDSLVVNKSTVPVKTAAKVQAIINQKLFERNCKINVTVASNPEFLREGSALFDFLYPDRVVVGVSCANDAEILYRLYKPFLRVDSKFLVMNPESSELTKYGANAMLATKISFMNQLALLCEKVGADIKHIQLGMGSDKRIGPDFLNAGIGYGGSCFPKDVSALIDIGRQFGQVMGLISEVENINKIQRAEFLKKIFSFYGADISKKTAGIWGLSFKPETDDIRCAPSIDVISDLVQAGLNLVVYDPVATENIKKIFGEKINYAQNENEVLDKADFLIILTEWKQFLNRSAVDFTKLRDRVIFDGRNCYDAKDLNSVGIKYFCIGRADVGCDFLNFAKVTNSKNCFL